MTATPPSVRYSRARLDALTDGLYGVAMTLLVLDVRLPDDFHPTTTAQLWQGLVGLAPKFLPYLLSFYVLGVRWLASVEVHSHAESLSGGYMRWGLANLLLVTLVPFTTIVVGRYASLAPAAWLYGGNMALLAVVAWWQFRLLPDVQDRERLRQRQATALLLMASGLLCIAVSFVSPAHAYWAFALNLAQPYLNRRHG